MFENIPIPSSFSLVRKGKVFLLLRNEYKDLLLQQGIEDPQAFLQEHRRTSRYLTGRTPHPSIPVKEGLRMVIRQYSHGGLFRAFTRDFYLFGSRSFKELVLTEEVLSHGISTIKPIGAIHQLIVPHVYKAYLLSLEISEAKDLIQFLQEIGLHPFHNELLHKRKTIRSAGLLLRQFHESGFFHGDLQLKNILVKIDQLFLIDFDRSYQKKVLSTKERIKNLLRLNRSAEKWRHLGLSITRTDRFRFFQAYAGEDEEIWKAMRKAVRTYSIRHFFHRWSWALQRILKK